MTDPFADDLHRTESPERLEYSQRNYYRDEQRLNPIATVARILVVVGLLGWMACR